MYFFSCILKIFFISIYKMKFLIFPFISKTVTQVNNCKIHMQWLMPNLCILCNNIKRNETKEKNWDMCCVLHMSDHLINSTRRHWVTQHNNNKKWKKNEEVNWTLFWSLKCMQCNVFFFFVFLLFLFLIKTICACMYIFTLIWRKTQND